MKLSEYLPHILKNIISMSEYKDIEICDITNDPKKVVDGSIFVAIDGDDFDGHDFIDNAIKAGAKVIIYQDQLKDTDTRTDHDKQRFASKIIFFRVDNSFYAFSVLSEVFFHSPAKKLKIIGVTGTNGKTTCAFLINFILNRLGFKSGLISTVYDSYGDKIFPTEWTTPEAYELQKLFLKMYEYGCEYVIMEVSSHGLHQHRLGNTKFEAALFTNLSGDHLDYHENMENYYQVKKTLFDGSYADEGKMKKIINFDDAYGKRLIEELGENVITYASCIGGNSNYQFTCDGNGTIVGLIANGDFYPIITQLIGEFNAYNITSAIAVCAGLGLPLGEIIEAVEYFKPAPGRLEPFITSKNVKCYIDYAHTDDAIRRALTALRKLQPARLIVVFGCGGDRDKTKRPRMGKVASELADIVILTDDNPRTEKSTNILEDIKKGISNLEMLKIIPNRRKAIKYAVEIANSDDIVLVAGKGHEDYQIIGRTKFPFDDRKIISKL